MRKQPMMGEPASLSLSSGLEEPSLSPHSRNLLHVLLLNSAVRPDRLACSIQVVSEAVLLPPR